MDWTAVGTILATGIVTFGSVWLKGRYDFRTEQARLNAQAVESRAARVESTSNDADARARAAKAEYRESGTTAMKVFGVILGGVSVNDRTSASVVQTVWNQNFDAQARQAVELIYDAKIRDDMGIVLTALSDFGNYVDVNVLSDFAGHHAKQLIQTLLELAGAVSRGEAPSPLLEGDMRVIRDRVKKVGEFFSTSSHRDS